MLTVPPCSDGKAKIEKIPARRMVRCAGVLLQENVLAVMMIDADHDGRRLNDGICLLADLKT